VHREVVFGAPKPKGARRGIFCAEPLRRDLLRAGVKRHVCTRAPDANPLKAGEACCPNMAHEPLFYETAATMPVDFHSFRRAFSTALAEVGRVVLRREPRDFVAIEFWHSAPRMRSIRRAAKQRRSNFTRSGIRCDNNCARSRTVIVFCDSCPLHLMVFSVHSLLTPA
jgi:hypothetical protein